MSKIERERGGRGEGGSEREGGVPFISAVLPGDRTHHINVSLNTSFGLISLAHNLL